MPRYNNNKFSRDSRGNRKDFYSQAKELIKVPDLPQMPETPSNFTKQITAKQGNYDTAFSRIRSYDVDLARIRLSIPGAAPIFGKEMPKKSYTLGDSLGLYTASLENAYYNSQFNSIFRIYRALTLNYWGIDGGITQAKNASGALTPLVKDHTGGPGTTNPFDSADERAAIGNVRNYHAVRTWLQNVATLRNQLAQSMYTDLRIFQYSLVPLLVSYTGKDGASALTKGTISAWSSIFNDAIAYMLLAYQHDILTVLFTVLYFESLLSQLPKLSEFYREKVDFFNYIISELRRPTYTAKVRDLMAWLKQRYVDVEYVKKYVLPFSVVSKATDGLNSPLMYLILTLETPYAAVSYTPIGTTDAKKAECPIFINFNAFSESTSAIPAMGNITYPVDNVDDDSHLNTRNRSCFYRTFNAFSIDVVLNVINQHDNITSFKTAITNFFRTAQSSLETIRANALDMAQSQITIDIETALSKLATAPGGMNWKTDTSFTSIPPVYNYSNWDLVSDAVLFSASEPIVQGSTAAQNNAQNPVMGYNMLLPLYIDTGLPVQLLHTYSQSFYLPSNDVTFSSFKLGDTIMAATKRGERIIAKIQNGNSKLVSDYQNIHVPVLVIYPEAADPFNGQMITTDKNYSYLLNTTAWPLIYNYTFADNGTPNSGRSLHKNPRIWTYVMAAFENKWADLVMDATRNFIIPLV